MKKLLQTCFALGLMTQTLVAELPRQAPCGGSPRIQIRVNNQTDQDLVVLSWDRKVDSLADAHPSDSFSHDVKFLVPRKNTRSGEISSYQTPSGLISLFSFLDINNKTDVLYDTVGVGLLRDQRTCQLKVKQCVSMHQKSVCHAQVKSQGKEVQVDVKLQSR